MKLPIYQVDAFASRIFEGNPAAVCPLDKWLPEEVLQRIAMENNLSETAFFVRQENSFRLRWFTPTVEVDLCGHATLAAAHVLFEHLGFGDETIKFDSNSGELTVRKEHGLLMMDFPAARLNQAELPPLLEKAVGVSPRELYKDADYLFVVENEAQVRKVDPDLKLLAQADARGIIVTAPGDEYDFVSRFFAPAVGVDEDPVTGSAHTLLTPYWSKRLGKRQLVGRQVSKRGGTVHCHMKGGRVVLGGKAQTFLEGQITI